jgi:hypothetical protein
MPLNWDLSFRVRVRSECVPSIFCSDESKVLILCCDAMDMSTYIRVGADLSLTNITVLMCKENAASKEVANSSQLNWEMSCHMLTTTVRKQGFIGDFSESTCPVSRVCYNYMESICEHRTVDSTRRNFTIRKNSKWGRAQYSGHFLDVWFVPNPFNSKLDKTYCASVRPQWLTHTVCVCDLCQG